MSAFAAKTAAELLAKTREQMERLRHERKQALELADQKSAAIDAIESVLWRIEDLAKHEAASKVAVEEPQPSIEAEERVAALKAKLAEAKAERLNYRAECLELLRRIREGQLVTATEASMRYESIIAAISEEPL